MSDKKEKKSETAFLYDEKNIARQVRRAIKERGIPQSFVIRESGMTADEWINCEKGKAEFPTGVLMELLVAINNVDLPVEEVEYEGFTSIVGPTRTLFKWSCEEIGQFLAILRKDRKWSKRFICEEIRIPSGEWTKCESGEQMPSYQLLCRLLIYTRKNRKRVKVKKRPVKTAKEIGRRIREIRLQRGQTQEIFAESIGVTQENWSQYENGKIIPSADVLLLLSDTPYCRIDYLLARSNTKTDFDITGYDMARALSNLLLYAGVEAELTDDGKLVLSVQKGSTHEKTIKAVAKKTLRFCKDIRDKADIMNVNSAQLNQMGFFHDMRIQYDNKNLTEKCDQYYRD